jgi:serine/threonine protein kinase
MAEIDAGSSSNLLPGGRPMGPDGIPVVWEPGDAILDLYEVKATLGKGGMGQVDRVWHRQWQRDLAVKSVLPERAASAAAIECFTTEAEHWVDRIGLHPNVVACHYVRVLGGVPRVFIEYVEGGTLQEWITSKRLYEGGPQAALKRILDVAIQTAWGLDYVHEQGLIHQDVKPLNVMMTAEGVAKVTDFGLAGARAAAFVESEQQPAAGTILASFGGGMTPEYCSPEQADIAAKKAAGIPREQWPKLTRRTDVWSWAVSVLEMFLGERTWPVGSVAFVGLQHEPDEPHLPQLPPAVKDLLHSCLEQLPEDRPHDLKQVADALQSTYQQEVGQPFPRPQPRPEDQLADTCNNRGVSLMDLRKQEAAEKKWQEALSVDPLHPEATYNWGLIQWRSGRMTDLELLAKLQGVRKSVVDAWEWNQNAINWGAAIARGRGAGGPELRRLDYLMGLVHLERTDARAAVQLLNKALEGGTGPGPTHQKLP